MIRWLRRQAANYTSITRYLLAAEHARAQRDEANARAIAAIHLAVAAWQAAEIAYRHADGARALMWSMTEPEGVEGCVKVRLRDETEALTFAARVRADTGVACEPYPCRLCPRQPVSTAKFWHVRSIDPQQRGRRRGPHRHQALLLRHVSTEEIDALRARLFGEAS